MEEQTIVPEVLLDKAIELGLSFSDSAFPIGIFPSQIRNIIAEVHECQGFPIDYIASAMLVAIARHREYASCPTQTRLARECNALCGISWTPRQK